MAAARQGLPVRLDRAPQRGAAFAITRASRGARTRSITILRHTFNLNNEPTPWACFARVRVLDRAEEYCALMSDRFP